MSDRPHVYVSLRNFAASPPSPNQFKPWVTAEIRLFYPTGQEAAARDDLMAAYELALEELTDRIRCRAPHPE